jgi:hypothetical protein
MTWFRKNRRPGSPTKAKLNAVANGKSLAWKVQRPPPVERCGMVDRVAVFVKEGLQEIMAG